jgi:hypothetical protein
MVFSLSLARLHSTGYKAGRLLIGLGNSGIGVYFKASVNVSVASV